MEYNDRKKRISCERPGVAQRPSKRKKIGSERKEVRFMRAKKVEHFRGEVDSSISQHREDMP